MGKTNQKNTQHGKNATTWYYLVDSGIFYDTAHEVWEVLQNRFS